MKLKLSHDTFTQYDLALFPLYPFIAVSAIEPDSSNNDWSDWGTQEYLAYEDVVFCALDQDADLSEDIAVTVLIQSLLSTSTPNKVIFLEGKSDDNLIFEGYLKLAKQKIAVWTELPADFFVSLNVDMAKICVYSNDKRPNEISIVVTKP